MARRDPPRAARRVRGVPRATSSRSPTACSATSGAPRTWCRRRGCAGSAGEVEADSPRAYLVTRRDAPLPQRARLARERGARRAAAIACPSPSISTTAGIGRVEALEQISMAFLVVLQRLTPAERAVLLLHDVFDFGHAEIAALVGKSEPRLPQAARARAASTSPRSGACWRPSPEEHRRLLAAFMTRGLARATSARSSALLADDAVMITDGGPEGRRVGRRPQPAARRSQGAAAHRGVRRRGDRARAARPATSRSASSTASPRSSSAATDAPFAALLLGVADGAIQRVFFHADPARLGHLARAGPDEPW